MQAKQGPQSSHQTTKGKGLTADHQDLTSQKGDQPCKTEAGLAEEASVGAEAWVEAGASLVIFTAEALKTGMQTKMAWQKEAGAEGGLSPGDVLGLADLEGVLRGVAAEWRADLTHSEAEVLSHSEGEEGGGLYQTMTWGAQYPSAEGREGPVGGAQAGDLLQGGVALSQGGVVHPQLSKEGLQMLILL